ncbi:phage tail protein [Pseudomonas sp. R2.Fl]|nr:phage tail protein [Pseudomonas sp. R2.Fl]
MKLAKVMLCTSASYLAAIAPAHAEPVSFFIFSALYTIGIPGAIANAISLIAIPAALVAASVAFSPSLPGAVKPSDAKANFETGDSSVMEGIGRVRVGGLNAFGNSDGSTRARLTCRLQGPIDAVEEYYIGGREVIVEPNGDVSSPPWARSGGSWCSWRDKIGTGSETAWSQLISLFPTLWTSAHRVRGIAQSLTIWYNPGLSEPKYFTLYQGGIPVTEEVVRASLIFDPRDGTQVADSPTSWKWSDNGILACAHVLRRDPRWTSAMIDWALIEQEADRADALVATKTGTEKRARAWGIFPWESSRLDVLQQVLDSIGAELRITDQGKVWFQLIDDAHVSEIDFTPRDEIEVTWKSGPDAVERPNICRLTYYSPERNYDTAEIDLTGIAWARAQDEVERYGPKYFDLDLPFCPSASQAQRIARRKFAQARGDTGTLATGFIGFAAWGILLGSVELPDLGDVLPMRMEPMRVDDASGTVEIPFSVWPTLPAWNPATMEAAAPDPIPDLEYQSDIQTPNAPTQALQITYPVGGGKELRIAYSMPAVEYDTIEAAYRTYSGGLPNSWTGMTEQSTFAYDAVDAEGSQIDARVRIFNEDEGSNFSPVLSTTVGVSNTAPAAPSQISNTSSVSSVNVIFDVLVEASQLRVAGIRLQRRQHSAIDDWSDWSTLDTQNARPGQDRAFADIFVWPGLVGQVQYRLFCLTSNGTTGDPLTYTFTAPED